MRRVTPDDAPPYYVFDRLDPAGEDVAAHAVFTRHGGVSVAPYDALNVSSSIGDDPAAVVANRGRVLAALDRPRAGLVMAGLVHGVAVARVDLRSLRLLAVSATLMGTWTGAHAWVAAATRAAMGGYDMAAEPTPRPDEPVTADAREADAVREVARLLADSAGDDAVGAIRLTTPDGQALDLPASMRKILQQAIPLLTQGDAVTVASWHKELTTQEAADFLNVSRPSLIKLLEDGAIPYSKVGTHRRVRLSDILAYRQQRSNVRKDLFQWMLDVAQEQNAYD